MALFSVGSHSPTSSSAVSMCLLLRQWGFAASLLWHRKDPGICQQHHVSEPDVTQIQDLPVGVAHEQDAIQEWICLGSGAIHHWAMKNTNLQRDCCLLVPTNIRCWLFHHAVSDTFAWSYESYSAVRIQSRAWFPGKSHSKTWRGSITPLGVSKTAPFINFSVAVVFKGEKSFLLTSWWKKKSEIQTLKWWGSTITYSQTAVWCSLHLIGRLHAANACKDTFPSKSSKSALFILTCHISYFSHQLASWLQLSPALGRQLLIPL